MVGRKSNRRRMLGQVMQPKRLRMPDQLAENPMPLWIGTDALDLLFGETDSEKSRDLAVLSDDAHRGVLRIDERGGRLHDPSEDGLELEASSHCQNNLEQTPDPIPRR